MKQSTIGVPCPGKCVAVHALDGQRKRSALITCHSVSANKTGTLSGDWIRDAASSESIKPTCELFNIGFVLRKAIEVLPRISLEDTEVDFTTSIDAVVLQIQETYPKDGSPRQYPRRDLRQGKLTGRFVLDPQGKSTIIAEWNDPFAGQATDVFDLSADGNTLTQQTTYVKQATGESTSYKTVYRRGAAASDSDW